MIIAAERRITNAMCKEGEPSCSSSFIVPRLNLRLRLRLRHIHSRFSFPYCL